MAYPQTSQLVAQLYISLKAIVEKYPDAQVGEATVAVIRDAIQAAKADGIDGKLCDSLLTHLRPIGAGNRVLANDAFIVVGQIYAVLPDPPRRS